MPQFTSQPTETPHCPRLILVGITGYGGLYVSLLRQAQLENRVRLVAVVAINHAEVPEKCDELRSRGVAIYGSWAELLAARVEADLCILPVPIHLHAQMAVEAMAAGYNVLLEKPLTGSVAQAKSILAAEEATGKWVAVGYQDVYHPLTASIRRDLARGRIGRISQVKLSGFWPRGSAYFGRNSWAGKLSLNGVPLRDSPLNNAMAHFLNLALHWASGKADAVAVPCRVEAELYRCNDIESFDTGVMRALCDSGVQILAGVTHACSVQKPVRVQVCGDKGDFTWIHMQHAVWPDGETVSLEDRISHGEMLNAVLRRLEDASTPVCTVRDAMAQVLCIEQLHAAAPIISVSPGQWHEESSADNTFRCLDGADEVLERCVREMALPRELGLSWQSAGECPAPAAAEAHSR